MNPIVMTPFDYARLNALLDNLSDRGGIDRHVIEQLDRELERAQIVEDGRLPTDIVTMNSEVVVDDVDTGEQLQLRVVFPSQADIERGWISVLAPVGLAILGAREGDELTWRTPRRQRRLRIRRVLYQPEAEGERL